MAKKKIAATLRKPPSPRGLEELDVFVEGGSTPLHTGVHELRPSALPKASATKKRETRQLQVEIEPALMEQLSLHCLSSNHEIDAVVADAIRGHLLADSQRARPSGESQPQPRLRGIWRAFGFVD